MDEKKYNLIAEELKPKKQVLKNTFFAFLFGGIIGMIGQFFLDLYQQLFSFGSYSNSYVYHNIILCF